MSFDSSCIAARWRRGVIPLVLLFLLCCSPLFAQVTLTLSKTHNAPSPVPSGQPFTYTIAYSWSGGAPGTIVIRDTLPSSLDVISTLPATTPAGNIVTFNLTGLTASAGAGTVQINARFKPGVTCNGVRACNIAYISTQASGNQIASNQVCVTASATNKWTFDKSLIAGCAVDNDVIFRVCVINPSGGDIGGLNLTNVTLTDVLPAGAIVTSVSGSWSTFTQVGTNITLGGGPSTLPVSPWNAWYCVYLHVTFPTPTFSTGQQVVNSATLSYKTPCDTAKFSTYTDTARVTLCAPNPGGSLWKGLSINMYFPSNPFYYPAFSPGCCGTYTLSYTNTGNVAQPGFVMEDVLPTTLDVTAIRTNVPAGNTPVTLSVYCWSGTSCSTTPCFTTTYNTPGTQVLTTLPPNICKVRWTYSNSIAILQNVQNSLDVCVRPASFAPPFNLVTSGQNIVNTVTAQASNLSLISASVTKPVDSLKPKILASKFFMGACGTTCTPETAGPFLPGQIVRWRMAVANVGNVNASPCTITDLLPTGLTYVGNPTYYYGTFNWMANQYNPPCCSLSTTVPSQIGGSIATPSPGDTNLVWSFPTLPFKCDGSVDYLVIEFDVKIGDNPPVPPGQYPNTFTFSAGNLSTPVTSNVAFLTVNAIAQLTIVKEVRPKTPSGTFAANALVGAGAQAEFRIRVKNTGNLALSNICLLDIMPHIGDTSVLPAYLPRGSMFDMPITGAGNVVTPGGYATTFGNSGNTKNPKRSLVCAGFCGAADPLGSVVVNYGGFTTNTYSFVTSGGSTQLAPGGTLDIYVTATVPTTATVGQTACNSFGVRAVPVSTTTCLSTQSVPACVRVAEKPVDNCRELWRERIVDSCCGLSLTLSNSLGAITQIGYNVLPIAPSTSPSGTIQSVQTSPCNPTTTVPTNLSGTTSGVLNFAPGCTGASPLNLNLQAASNTASGEICIELIVTIQRPGQNPLVCRDTVCFRCDRIPQTRCDSMSVKPFPFNDLDLSGRTFTIYNMKSPSSPICSVKIVVTPPPSGPGVNGGGLYVDGIWKPWPFGTSNGYTEIKGIHGLPANSTVKFNLGIDYTIGWVGTVSVTAYHCDGDSCEMKYGPWHATKKDVILVGTPVDIAEKARLKVYRLSFPRAKARGLDIRSIAVKHNDPVESIVAVTGASFPCDTAGDCDDGYELLRVRQRLVMVDLRYALDSMKGNGDPAITVLYLSTGDQQPTVDIVYYDGSGAEVGHETATVTGHTLRGGDDDPLGILGSLTAHPNPTTGRCELGFRLPSAARVDMELIDSRGDRVATILSGEKLPAGDHMRTIDMSTLPNGSYLVSLRIDGVPTSVRVELMR